MPEGPFVVGASLAGLRAVESARKNGYTGRLLLVGARSTRPTSGHHCPRPSSSPATTRLCRTTAPRTSSAPWTSSCGSAPPRPRSTPLAGRSPWAETGSCASSDWSSRRVRAPGSCLGSSSAAAFRRPRRPHQRAGRGASSGHGQGPGPAHRGPGILQRGHGAGAGRLRRVPHHHHPFEHRVGLRCLPAGGGAPLRRGARGGAARRRAPDDPDPPTAPHPRASPPPFPRCPAQWARPGPPRWARCSARGGGTRAVMPMWVCGPRRRRIRVGAGTPHVDWLRALLGPEAADPEIERFELPNLRALNVVVCGLLGEGVASSTRPDPQAKGLGEHLRSRVVEIPESLLDRH